MEHRRCMSDSSEIRQKNRATRSSLLRNHHICRRKPWLLYRIGYRHSHARVRLKSGGLGLCGRALLLLVMLEFINSTGLAGRATVQGRPVQCCAGHPPMVPMFAPKEPEYVCSYEGGVESVSMADERLTSAQRYRSYLSATNVRADIQAMRRLSFIEKSIG